MHRSCVVGVRVASSAAAVVGLVVIQFATLTSSYADDGPIVVAVIVTPTTIAAPFGAGFSQTQTQPQLTPTVIATPTLVGQPPELAGQPAPAVPSALQQASDRIAVVSQQVADAVHDPSLTIDAKVQRINTLASQFNQLVAQWQQQLPQSSAAAGTIPAVGTPQAVPPGLVAPVPTSPTGPIPGQPVGGPAQTGGTNADQLRAQIAAISQRMTQISQDPTLSSDAKTTQLAALGAQFNQLMMQLQQLGG